MDPKYLLMRFQVNIKSVIIIVIIITDILSTCPVLGFILYQHNSFDIHNNPVIQMLLLTTFKKQKG